jgi:hypothetical protein
VSVVGAGATVTVTGPVVLFEGLLPSFAFTVMVLEPAVVGVPLMVHPVNVSPAGSVPPTRVQV